MIRLRKIYAGLFLLCSMSANAQSFSLKDAVDYAIVHHVQVKNSQIDLQNAGAKINEIKACLLYTSPSPRDRSVSRMPSSA